MDCDLFLDLGDCRIYGIVTERADYLFDGAFVAIIPSLGQRIPVLNRVEMVFDTRADALFAIAAVACEVHG